MIVFTGSSETLENHSQIMMTSLQIPYRWYKIPDGVYTTTSVHAQKVPYRWYNIPDGVYITTSVNAYMQQLCIDNGLCFIEDRTSYCFVYYLSDPYNAAYYAIQLPSKTVPTSLQGCRQSQTRRSLAIDHNGSEWPIRSDPSGQTEDHYTHMQDLAREQRDTA